MSDRRLGGVVEGSWLAALLFVPLVVAPHHAVGFDRPKSAWIAAFAILGSAAWALRVASGGAAWRPLVASGPLRGAVGRVVAGLGLSALGLVASTATALSPRLAFFGTDERALGAATQLAVLVLAFLMLAELRNRAQFLRAVEAIVLASLPLALVAVLQAFGLDPVFPGLDSERTFSWTGNPNVLARYLMVSLLLTAGLLYDALDRRRGHAADGRRQGLLLALLGLQAWGLAATGSAGALLGLAAGAAVAAIGLVTPGLRPATRRRRDRGMVVLAALTVVVFATLAWRQAARNPEAGTAVRRGITVLTSADSGSAQVRWELWRLASRAFHAPEPLVGADGEDSLHTLRPWLGHGPGLSTAPLVRHADRRLTELRRGKIPNEAHNRAWDTLLARGALGAAGWVVLHFALIEVLFARLGIVRSGRAVAALWATLAVAAVAVGSAGAALSERPGMGPPAAVAGVLVGACVFAAARFFRSPGRSSAEGSAWVVFVAAAGLARMVSDQFAVATCLDALTAACLVALLTTPCRSGPTARRPASRWTSPLVAVGLVLTVSWIVVAARHAGLGGPNVGVSQLWAAAWLGSATVLGLALLERGRGGWRYAVVAPALGVAIGLHVALAGRLAALSAAGRVGPGLASARLEIALAWTLLAVLTAGVVVWGRLSYSGRAVTRQRARFAALAVVVPAACFLLWRFSARPVAAGFLLRGAARAAATEAPTEARRLFSGAARWSDDPALTATRWAELERNVALLASEPDARETHLETARAVLQRAVDVSQYDSDLVGNVGLIELARLDTATGESRRRFALRAAASFEAALRLRPAGGPWRAHLHRARAVAGQAGPASALEPP